MYASSINDLRNRVLILMFAMLFATSLGWNVKQLFDINNYKKLYQETTELLGHAMVQNPLIAVQNFGQQFMQSTLPVAETKIKEVSKQDLQCLSENIYFEAGNQGIAGKVAVGNVTLNRVGRPNYPKTVCGVINHKIGEVCMFSWKCEPPKPIFHNSLAWKQSQQVAFDLLSKDRKDVIDITEGATHFHNTTVRPNWKMKTTAKIGDHTFYRQ